LFSIFFGTVFVAFGLVVVGIDLDLVAVGTLAGPEFIQLGGNGIRVFLRVNLVGEVAVDEHDQSDKAKQDQQ